MEFTYNSNSIQLCEPNIEAIDCEWRKQLRAHAQRAYIVA